MVSRLRHLLAGLLFLVLPGCGLAGSSQPVSSGPSPAATMSTAQRFAAARPAIETYLKALALHREADAQPVVQAAGSYATS